MLSSFFWLGKSMCVLQPFAVSYLSFYLGVTFAVYLCFHYLRWSSCLHFNTEQILQFYFSPLLSTTSICTWVPLWLFICDFITSDEASVCIWIQTQSFSFIPVWFFFVSLEKKQLFLRLNPDQTLLLEGTVVATWIALQPFVVYYLIFLCGSHFYFPLVVYVGMKQLFTLEYQSNPSVLFQFEFDCFALLEKKQLFAFESRPSVLTSGNSCLHFSLLLSTTWISTCVLLQVLCFDPLSTHFFALLEKRQWFAFDSRPNILTWGVVFTDNLRMTSALIYLCFFVLRRVCKRWFANAMRFLARPEHLVGCASNACRRPAGRSTFVGRCVEWASAARCASIFCGGRNTRPRGVCLH